MKLTIEVTVEMNQTDPDFVASKISIEAEDADTLQSLARVCGQAVENLAEETVYKRSAQESGEECYGE